MLEVLAQALQRLQLRLHLGQLLLRLGDFHCLAAAGQHALGFFLGRAHGRLVDVLGAHRGVGRVVAGKADIDLTDIALRRPSLDEVFLALTGDHPKTFEGDSEKHPADADAYA